MSVADDTTFDGSPGPAGCAARADKNGEHAKPKEAAGSTGNRPPTPAVSVKIADRKAFDRLLTQLRREYKPVGAIQKLFVEQVAHCALQMKQVAALEADRMRAMTAPPMSPVISEELRKSLFAAAIAFAIPKDQPVTAKAIVAAISSIPMALLKLLEARLDTSSLSVPDLSWLFKFQRYGA